MRDLGLSDQQLQGNTTKPNLKADAEKANAEGTAQLWMSCPGPNSMIKDIP